MEEEELLPPPPKKVSSKTVVVEEDFLLPPPPKKEKAIPSFSTDIKNTNTLPVIKDSPLQANVAEVVVDKPVKTAKNLLLEKAAKENYSAPLEGVNADVNSFDNYTIREARKLRMGTHSGNLMAAIEKEPDLYIKKASTSNYGKQFVPETPNIENISKAIDLYAEKIKRTTGEDITVYDKQYLVNSVAEQVKNKKDIGTKVALTNLEATKKLGMPLTAFTGVKDEKGNVITKGIFEKANEKIIKEQDNEIQNYKINSENLTKNVAAEVAPEVDALKLEVKSKADILNQEVSSTFNKLFEEKDKALYAQYNQLVQSGQMTAEQANQELKLKREEIQVQTQAEVTAAFVPKFDELNKEVNLKSKDIQSRYNRNYLAKANLLKEAADKKLQEIAQNNAVDLPKGYMEAYGKIFQEQSAIVDKQNINKAYLDAKNTPFSARMNKAMTAGFGDVLGSIGGAMSYAGLDASAINDVVIKTAMQNELASGAYYQIKDEESKAKGEEYGNFIEKLSDSSWWIDNGVRSVPFMLATMPVGMAAGYGAGALARLLGASKRAAVISSVVGGGTVSWAGEATLEAGSAFNDALKQGYSENDASAIASRTFRNNLATLPLSVFQMMPVFSKAFNFTKALAMETALGGAEEIIQGWSQAEANAAANGFDVSLFEYAKTPQALEEGIIGAAMSSGMSMFALDSTPNIDKQISLLMSSVSVGGEQHARQVLDIMNKSKAITDAQYKEANLQLDYIMNGIESVQNFNVDDNVKVGLVGKFAKIGRAKAMLTDDENDLASQAAKEMIAEQEKEIKEILKGSTPLYLVFEKGNPIPTTTTKEQFDSILKDPKLRNIFTLQAINDDALQSKIDETYKTGVVTEEVTTNAEQEVMPSTETPAAPPSGVSGEVQESGDVEAQKVKYVPTEKQNEIIEKKVGNKEKRTLNSSWADWFLGESQEAKSYISDDISKNPELQDAMKSKLYDEWKKQNNSNISFDNFLKSEIDLYRGGKEGNKNEVDVDGFNSWELTEEGAKKFSKGEPVTKVTKKVKDLYGAIDIVGGEIEIIEPTKLSEDYAKKVFESQEMTDKMFDNLSREEQKKVILLSKSGKYNEALNLANELLKSRNQSITTNEQQNDEESNNNQKIANEANGQVVLEGVRQTGNEDEGRKDSEQLREEEVGKPLSEQIADLRAAEKAEYAALKNPTEKAKKKIYDKYDKLITPLIREQKAAKKVAEVSPKEGDTSVTKSARGMIQNMTFKDGEWQMKFGKDFTKVAKSAQQEAQDAFNEKNIPIAEVKEQAPVIEAPKEEKNDNYYIYDFDNKAFIKVENAKPVKLDTEGDFFAVKGDNGYYTIHEGTSGQGIGESKKLLKDAIKNANERIEANAKAGLPIEKAISNGIKKNGQSPRVEQAPKLEMPIIEETVTEPTAVEEEEEQYELITVSDTSHDTFTKDNAVDYEEGEREGDNGRSYTYLASVTVELVDDVSGETLGTISKLKDEDGEITWSAETNDGDQVADEVGSKSEAQKALVDNFNKQKLKEFNKEKAKAAKEKIKEAEKAKKKAEKEAEKATKAAEKSKPVQTEKEKAKEKAKEALRERKTKKDEAVNITNKSSLEELENNNKNNQLKTKIIAQAKKAIVALKSILPNFDIYIHDTVEGYNEQMEEVNGVKNSVGNFAYSNIDGNYIGRIDINLNTANLRTIAHEVSHAVMLVAFGENPLLFKDFRNKISDILSTETNKKLTEFADRYRDNPDVIDEEYLVELAAVLSETKGKMKLSTLSRIAIKVNEIVSKLTNGKIVVFDDIRNTNDIIEFFNSFSEGITKGADIKNIIKDYSGTLYEPTSLNIKGKLSEPLPTTGRTPKSKASRGEFDLVPHPIIDKNMMVNKKYSVTMSDHTKVGEYKNDKTNVNIKNLMGGVFFPYIKGVRDAGLAWASVTTKAAREMVLNAANQDYTLIYRMARSTGSRGNVNFNEIAFAELTAPVDNGKVTEKELLKKLNDKLNTVSKGKQLGAGKYILGKLGVDTNETLTVNKTEIVKEENAKGKLVNKVKNILDKDGNNVLIKITKKEIPSLNALKIGLMKESFGKRGDFWSVILKDSYSKKSTGEWYKFLEKYEVTSLEDIVNNLAEPEVDSAKDHDVVGAIKIAPPEYDERGNVKIYTTRKSLVNEAKGVYFIDAPDHPSYPYVVKGEPVGIFNEFNQITDYFPVISKWIKSKRLNSPYKAVETMGKELVETLDPTATGFKSKSQIVEPTSDAWTPSLTEKEVNDVTNGAYTENLDKRELEGTAHATQVATTKGTYIKWANWLKGNMPDIKNARILDVGAGFGHIHKPFKQILGIEAESYEPFYNKQKYLLHAGKAKPDYLKMDASDVPKGKFDVVVNNAVLNVVPADIRDNVVRVIGESIKNGGIGIISAMNFDYTKGQINKINEGKSKNIKLSDSEVFTYESGKYTYQKGFKTPEIVAYVQDVLGDDYVVSAAPSGLKQMATVLIKKNNNIKSKAQKNNQAENIDQDLVDTIVDIKAEGLLDDKDIIDTFTEDGEYSKEQVQAALDFISKPTENESPTATTEQAEFTPNVKDIKAFEKILETTSGAIRNKNIVDAVKVNPKIQEIMDNFDELKKQLMASVELTEDCSW